MKEDKLSFLPWCLFLLFFFYLFVCFINEVQRKILFSDVTVTLHKRVLLVFVEAADTLFGYIKPCGVGGFESEGNCNAPVCATAQWKSGSVLPGLYSFSQGSCGNLNLPLFT